ncbi:hypothetical protein [Lentilactobacillus sp. SPB1-3]|uniref:Uncharacterized protein n=1 Tax=Lentilactobacillus terminaliae TaxID=3003483 RepID=A0ACD5DEB6_9LACO|nr:hypothetical protein [Lentilactobacillus sp. SPB1-3]MCZ0978155.1 hypothetical protein [Lentilactobacillus sp. SPB1-3]
MKREIFIADVYKDTEYMTLKEFYTSLRHDLGLDNDFFMYDYPVPENKEEYDKAIEVAKLFTSKAEERKKHPVDRETEINNLLNALHENNNK